MPTTQTGEIAQMASASRFAALIVLPLASVCVGQQDQELRNGHIIRCGWRFDAAGTEIAGYLFGERDETGGPCMLKWEGMGDDVLEPPILLAMPFDLPGDCELVLESAAPQFLVTGVKYLGGVVPDNYLCRIELRQQPREIVILDQRQDAGVDFQSITFNSQDQRIYAVDSYGDQLLTAPWSGAGQALPALQAITLGTPGLQVHLASDRPHVSADVDHGSGAYLIGVMGSLDQHWFRVYLDQGVWTAEPLDARYAGNAKWVCCPKHCSQLLEVYHTSLSSLGGPVAFSVADADSGAVVATGIHPGGVGDVVFLPWPANLSDNPGYSYVVQDSLVTSDEFTPLIDYGAPVPSAALIPEDLNVHSNGARVGNLLHGVHVRFHMAENPPTAATVVALLVVGFRSSGVDPVTPLGTSQCNEGYLLNSEIGVAHEVEVYPGKLNYGYWQGLAIPPGSTLEGNVVLYQAAFLDPVGGVAVSDVFGTTILEDVNSSQALLGAPPSPQGAAVDGMAAWCKTILDSNKTSGPRVEMLKRALSSMRLSATRACR